MENEAFVAENLVRQMEQGVLAPAPVYSNVKTFPWEYFPRKIYIFTGGYPCQPISNAGRLKGSSDHRWLWTYFKQGIKTIRPVWCFFENVVNHLNVGYDQVQNDLQELGYQVEAGIFSAEEIGAPQIRKRLFILAHADSGWEQQSRGHFSEGRGRDYDSCEEVDNAGGGRYIGTNNEVQTGRIGVKLANIKMGDTISTRSQRYAWDELLRRASEAGPERPASPASFPMGQGYEQYEWEAPRMLESSVGLSVNGYNYREDLLRMAGNSVCEQTAELAFRTLYRKLMLL